PSSRRTRRPIAIFTSAMSHAFRETRGGAVSAPGILPQLVLRRGRRQRGSNADEDRIHVGAGERDGGDRDERDERHEQRVLEQVLSFFATHEIPQTIDEFHSQFLRRAVRRRADAVCEMRSRFVRRPRDGKENATDVSRTPLAPQCSFIMSYVGCCMWFGAVSCHWVVVS